MEVKRIKISELKPPYKFVHNKTEWSVDYLFDNCVVAHSKYGQSKFLNNEVVCINQKQK